MSFAREYHFVSRSANSTATKGIYIAYNAALELVILSIIYYISLLYRYIIMVLTASIKCSLVDRKFGLDCSESFAYFRQGDAK